MLTDVWGLVTISPEVYCVADRIDGQNGSESYYASQNYQMNESRLFWLGYGAINQVIQPSPENSQNKILAATQAKSKNIGKPLASQVPNVRGKIRGNTTIGTSKASANTVTIDDNFVKRENQMIENKNNYRIGNRIYRGDINTASIYSGIVAGAGASVSYDHNEDYYGNRLPNTATVKGQAGVDITMIGVGVSSTWYSCPEEFVDADLMRTNSFKDDPDKAGYSLSIGIGLL